MKTIFAIIGLFLSCQFVLAGEYRESGYTYSNETIINSSILVSDGVIYGFLYDHAVDEERMGMMKVDTMGDIVWELSFAYSGRQAYFSDMVELANGDIIITGRWYLTNTDGKAFVAKISKDGEVLNQYELQDYRMDMFYSVDIAPDSSIYFVGNTSSYGTLSNQVWLRKMDKNLTYIWDRVYTDAEQSFGLSLEFFDNGDVAIGGLRTLNSGAKNEALLMRIDQTTGALKWLKGYSVFDKKERQASFTKLENGNFLLVGHTNSLVEVGDKYDLLLLEVDTLGAIVKAEALEHPLESFAPKVIWEKEGVIAIALYQEKEDDYYEKAIVKIDGDFNVLEAYYLGGGNEDAWGNTMTTVDYAYGKTLFSSRTKQYSNGLHYDFQGLVMDDELVHCDSTKLTFTKYDLDGKLVAYEPSYETVTKPSFSSTNLTQVETGLPHQKVDECFNVYEYEVYPGDCNDDGAVTMLDVLSVGIAFGNQGMVRNNASNEFVAQPVDEWGGDLIFDKDQAFVDADGNGLIERADISVIRKNYGMAYERSYQEQREGLPEVGLELLTTGQLQGGDTISFNLHAGSVDLPIEQLYGAAITVQYSNRLVQSYSFEADYSNSWLRDGDDAEFVAVDTQMINFNSIEFGLTRLDGKGIDGNGPLLSFVTIVDDLIAGEIQDKDSMDIDFWIQSATFVTFDQDTIDVTVSDTVAVVNVGSAIEEKFKPIDFSLYPNPAKGQVKIETALYGDLELRLLDVVGREVLVNQFTGRSFTLDVSELNQGIYFVELSDESSKAKTIRKLVIE